MPAGPSARSVSGRGTRARVVKSATRTVIPALLESEESVLWPGKAQGMVVCFISVTLLTNLVELSSVAAVGLTAMVDRAHGNSMRSKSAMRLFLLHRIRA